jgi:hypothetical protein
MILKLDFVSSLQQILKLNVVIIIIIIILFIYIYIYICAKGHKICVMFEIK